MLVRFSMVDSFITCPKCFHKRYILGVEDKTKSSAAEFGQAMHCAIRDHFEGGDALSTFQMYWNSVKDLDMVWYRYGWQELNDLAITKFIPNFLRMHAKNFSGFKIEETIEMPMDGFTLQGTFDMCGKYKDVLTMTDWKTSTNDYKPDRVKRNHQLYIYSALYKHKYGELPNSVMYKTFVKSKGSIQTTSAPVTEEILELHLRNIRSIVKNIVSMVESKSVYTNYNCYNERCLDE